MKLLNEYVKGMDPEEREKSLREAETIIENYLNSLTDEELEESKRRVKSYIIQEIEAKRV
jgi:ribosomal protein S17E